MNVKVLLYYVLVVVLDQWDWWYVAFDYLDTWDGLLMDP